MRCILICSLLLLSGCTQLQQAKSEKLGDGVYRLSAIGNVFTSKDELNKKLNERASLLCGGKENFEYLNEIETKEFEQETNPGGVSVEGNYQLYSRLVKCT